jgi:hypothetical protein
MIPEDKAIKLISIYFYVSEKYESEFKYSCQRYSNNHNPEFSDQEIITIYLFVMSQQRYFQVKSIHDFAREYLSSWFPCLPSYQAFSNRVNNLWDSFRLLLEDLLERFLPSDCLIGESLIDSFPIITCCGRNRKGKVAPELTGKGYCSTKEMYYYGVKLHALAFRRPLRIPFPERIIITKAEENDLTAFKQNWGDYIYNRTLYGDKIYIHDEYFSEKEQMQNYRMLTPIKLVKGESDFIRNMEKAYNDLYSKAVSTVRQPIESLFNWLIEKTGIQCASKVRSTKGLLLHLFGKLAVAFITLIF